MKQLHVAALMFAVFSLPAFAALPVVEPQGLDQYGCRTELNGTYLCFRGELSGKNFKNQDEMLAVREANTSSIDVIPLENSSAVAPITTVPDGKMGTNAGADNSSGVSTGTSGLGTDLTNFNGNPVRNDIPQTGVR